MDNFIIFRRIFIMNILIVRSCAVAWGALCECRSMCSANCPFRIVAILRRSMHFVESTCPVTFINHRLRADLHFDLPADAVNDRLVNRL